MVEKSGKKIREQATETDPADRASSVEVVEASKSVLNGGDNIMRSADMSQNDAKVRRKEEQISTT